MNCAEKLIRANNLLQSIHQVTIEFRLCNSLAQEKFKSNLEFRYQIIVSSMFLVLHPMESISLNSFVLLEHLAMLLTSTLAINC